MGLSPDPEKRARQLRNLSGGWPRAEQKHGLVKPEPADEPPESEPEPGSRLEVIDYDPPEATPAPAAKPTRGRRARPAGRSKPKAAPQPDPEPDPEPEPEPGAGGERGGFWSGFFGG